MQSPDACHGAIDDASQFGAKFRRAALNEVLLRFFGGKPGGVSIRFLRRFQPRHFAKVAATASSGGENLAAADRLPFAIPAVSRLRRK